MCECMSFVQPEYILVDTPDSIFKPPKVTNNFHPDVYYRNADVLIIGEAKTINDIDTKHSRNQYISYLQECQFFHGKAYLIVSSSWTASVMFKNLLKYIKRINNFTTTVIVLSEAGIPVLTI